MRSRTPRRWAWTLALNTAPTTSARASSWRSPERCLRRTRERDWISARLFINQAWAGLERRAALMTASMGMGEPPPPQGKRLIRTRKNVNEQAASNEETVLRGAIVRGSGELRTVAVFY